MSLTGNNNVLAHYEQSCGYDQISHALSNIHGLYGCSCNLLDVISVYSLNPGKLPGSFSYEKPGYEARNIYIPKSQVIGLTNFNFLAKYLTQLIFIHLHWTASKLH